MLGGGTIESLSQCGLQKAKRELLDQEDADRRIWGEQETLTLTLDVKLFTLLGKQ